MRILVITGDRSFKPGHSRFDLQSDAVAHLEAVYWAGRALFPRIPEGSFDVVSVQDPFLRGLFALYVARMKRARFNVQVHADLEAQSWWKKCIAGFVLRSADSIRVVSEKIKNQVTALGGSARISVLPLYVDIDRFREVVRAPQNPPVVLWIGRFEEEKDPLRAAQVFKTVRERGISTRLVMLGSGSLEARLKKEAEGFPVEFPGWQKDVVPYLAKASVVLSTSRAESWGASIVEALAAGVPVVAPDVGIAKEAGATVVSFNEMPDALIRTLSDNSQAEFTLNLLSRSEWQKAWQVAL